MLWVFQTFFGMNFVSKIQFITYFSDSRPLSILSILAVKNTAEFLVRSQELLVKICRETTNFPGLSQESSPE
jgi:hypothetical protein